MLLHANAVVRQIPLSEHCRTRPTMHLIDKRTGITRSLDSQMRYMLGTFSAGVLDAVKKRPWTPQTLFEITKHAHSLGLGDVDSEGQFYFRWTPIRIEERHGLWGFILTALDVGPRVYEGHDLSGEDPEDLLIILALHVFKSLDASRIDSHDAVSELAQFVANIGLQGHIRQAHC